MSSFDAKLREISQRYSDMPQKRNKYTSYRDCQSIPGQQFTSLYECLSEICTGLAIVAGHANYPGTNKTGEALLRIYTRIKKLFSCSLLQNRWKLLTYLNCFSTCMVCYTEDCTAIFLGKEHVAICNSSLSGWIRSFVIQVLAVNCYALYESFQAN